MAGSGACSRTDADETVAVYAARAGIAVLTGILAWYVFLAGTPLNHDDGIILHCGELLSRGWTPYVDFVELNPPMAYYVHAVPALLGRWLGLPVPGVFLACVFALVMYSAWGIWRMTGGYSQAGALFLTVCWVCYSVVLTLW